MKGLISLLCLIHTIGISQSADCDLKKQTDGINVYTCKSGNERFKTLQAEFLVYNTTLEELKYFLLNVDNYPTWQYNMIHAEILSHINDDELTYQSYINAPWPVEDREMMMKLKILPESTSGEMQIEMQTFESKHPVKEGFLRVPFMHGQWKVTSKDGALNVRYTLKIDPGGTIPAWLVNLAMAEGPYVSFRNLKRQLEE